MAEWRDLAIIFLTIGSAASGWFVREMWGAVRELRQDLVFLRESLPSTYARRDDVREMLEQVRDAMRDMTTEMRNGMNDLRDELRGKADK